MNLGGIPGAEHGLGFAIVTVLTLLVCVTLYKSSRRPTGCSGRYAVTSRRESATSGHGHGHGSDRRPT